MGRYTALKTVKQALRAPSSAQARSWAANEWDPLIEAAIGSAEELIDSTCGRSFDPAPTAAKAREWWPTHPQILVVGDVTGTGTTIAVAGGTLPASTWRWQTPPSSVSPGRRLIAVAPMRWPVGESVTVTARWGWPAVPDAVKTAATLMAARYFRRLDTPLGLVDVGDIAAYVPRLDPDVKTLLAPFAGPGLAPA